jgi:hypothetical protein
LVFFQKNKKILKKSKKFKKVLDKYEKNLYFAFAEKTKPMNLLCKKKLRTILWNFNRFIKDLGVETLETIIRTREQRD